MAFVLVSSCRHPEVRNDETKFLNEEDRRKVPLVEWVNKEEACARLGKSEKTLERFVLTGEIESRLEPRPGRKPERLYHAASIERCKTEDDSRREERKAKALGVPSALVPTVKPALIPADGQDAAEVLSAAVRAVPLHHKLWHTWDEASAYSGIPLASLRQLCDEGRIHAQRFGRRWRIRRASLEQFAG